MSAKHALRSTCTLRSHSEQNHPHLEPFTTHFRSLAPPPKPPPTPTYIQASHKNTRLIFLRVAIPKGVRDCGRCGPRGGALRRNRVLGVYDFLRHASSHPSRLEIR